MNAMTIGFHLHELMYSDFLGLSPFIIIPGTKPSATFKDVLIDFKDDYFS